jgi:hypothetical protein
MIFLTKLFQDFDFPTSYLDNIEDSVYNPTVYETFVAVKPEYAFLEKDVEFNMVQLSVVTTPSNIYAQKLSSFSILEDLNKKKKKLYQLFL